MTSTAGAHGVTVPARRATRRRGYTLALDAAVEEQALALHAAGAEEGAAEPAVGAGRDVHAACSPGSS